MARLWLGNVEDGTSDEDVGSFLAKYGFPAFSQIQHVAGDGPRPAFIVTFHGLDADVLRKLKERIHDMYWKHGRITAQVLSDDFA